MELLSSTLGCSMDELRYAICKSPQVLGFSETKLRAKIRVLGDQEALAVKGLIRKGLDFYHCVCMRDEVFVAKYIDHYEDALPGLADAYAAVRAGKLPAQV
ncbi:Os11g0206101 [Oryza sativa Japonica Group]|uniref:Uncharacterized protein n=2 Tax=Oryza sativa subsp. japonica TaxID=39947 RepID=A0A8J8XC46_ORYSJ|nr:hypothetical protein OsJ_33299 [Oryza sativa Japonica Group]KAB8114593.1 hypothetical protein EE612_054078 [Oryza sativa]BAT13123.1 Os11g0206101 [Oryza sativa Japonica Group]